MPASLPSEPPEPPPYRRRTRLGAMEYLGIPVLALLPLLSLSQALGPSEARQDARALGPLSMTLTHPARLRQKGSGLLEVVVSNTGSLPARELSIALDAAYLSHFSRVDSTPAAVSIGSGRWQVPLPPMGPGESQALRVQLEADDWGRLPGGVELVAPGQAVLARLDFSTLVLP